MEEGNAYLPGISIYEDTVMQTLWYLTGLGKKTIEQNLEMRNASHT